MRFGILGSTRAWRADGSEVALGGPARRALLACLLLTPGQVVPRERLIDVLYGDRPPGDVRHALQSQVSRLRRDGVAVELSAAGYLLAVAPDDVDAHRFLRLAAEGRDALPGDPGLSARLLREALALWRGPAVADLDPAFGAALEERRLEALEDRIEADLLRGRAREVIPELGELIDRHPLRERLRGQLMRALQAEGRQAEALVAFERARRVLADELGADPSPALTGLHRSLLHGEPAPAGPALPAPLTSFVGRERDVAAVRSLLGGARLVTLLGPGGAGKTRLAVEVARPYGDVCLAALAPVAGGGAIPRTVLAALGVRENGLLGPVRPGGAADETRLVQVIGERALLLVLDNCEHLVGEAAALAERLLAACPGLRVLATSREPLNVTGEHLWPVRPLAPDDAVRLFADRASAVRPGFAAGEAVARICATLDGLPLAIELAAARTRTHEPAELAGRLAHDDRFRLLSRGSRTADARHRTLRAVVAWSWDLLTAGEQAMARRLTVFPGGATASAATRVCALPGAEELLDSLADKSFVEVSGGRYRMLETIRAFCAEHLAAEEPAVRRAHAEHFLALAEESDAHLRREGQLDRLERLAAEHDNLMAALGWAVEAGEVATGMHLLGAMSSYLWMRGMRSAAAGPALALLEAAGDVPDPELGDDYVLCLLTAVSGGLTPAVREPWTRAAETLVARGERGRRRPLLAFLWPMVTAGGDHPQVTIQVIRQAAASPDPWERAVSGLVWAYPQMAEADFGAAERGLDAALAGFRALGDRWGAALVLDALAWMASVRGDDATALARVEEAVALAERLGAAEDLADLLCNRGDYRIRHDLAGARADYERAAEVARRVGLPTYVGTALRGLGDAAYQEGDLAGARGLYEQAVRLADPQWLKSSGSRARLLVGMGRLARAEGDLAAARAAFVQAVEVSLTVGAIPECARPIEALAVLETYATVPDAGRAARLLGVAAGVRGAESADPEVTRAAAAVRDLLGEPEYARVRGEGAGLGIAEACLLAGVAPEAVAASPLRSTSR
ncbi:BTAD domain-containing putative transcriptional regulator [Nonomuraea sp. ATR24]|uniref:BTAD domain-containing putative transcriptional regulator n=1 Tax=Nonomuraea sp. ATR24 TaxID=1676744 RepID=UPI0035BF1E5E